MTFSLWFWWHRLKRPSTLRIATFRVFRDFVQTHRASQKNWQGPAGAMGPLGIIIRRILGPIVGLLFGIVVLCTSVFGNYIVMLMLPILYVLGKNRKWRELMDRAASFWMVIILFFLRFVFRIEVRVSGDEIVYGKPGLVIMNHRTRLDWLYYWAVLWRMNPWLATSTKIALKEMLRHIPGVGFGMQIQQFIFLKRDLNTDLPRLSQAVEYYSDMQQSYQILMFPEGTDRTNYTLQRSQDYAKKNGLKQLKNVLYPRSSGFTHLITEMRKNDYLEYVYDVTVAYPKNIVQNETEMVLKGRLPSAVHYSIRRYHVSEIPKGETELTKWLLGVWYEKEERLEQYYSEPVKRKRQFHEDGGHVWYKDDVKQTAVVFGGTLFWITVCSVYGYHLTFMPLVQCTVIFLILNYLIIFGCYGGMDKLVYSMWEKSRRRVHQV